LYYRLKVVTVNLPPLRERREDIVPLSDHFRKIMSRRHHKPVKGISPAVSRSLVASVWKGNVRQLRNVIENMVVLDQDGILDLDDLPPDPELNEVPPAAAEGATGISRLLGQTMDVYERYAIEETLKLTNGNREEAARILEIGARTLYRKLEKYQIE
jgi:two-component system response regulator HydG